MGGWEVGSVDVTPGRTSTLPKTQMMSVKRPSVTNEGKEAPKHVPLHVSLLVSGLLN